MAKEVIWTEAAVKDRFKIYLFWLEHNKSDTYSKKLEQLFQKSAELISLFPEIGTPTNHLELRVKIVRGYALFYKNSESTIEIIRIWDTRQNPEGIELM
jgi:plasmid stabilization system protein ParE